MSDTIKFPLAALEQLCNEIDTSASDEIERLTKERDEAREEWGKASMDAAQLLSEKTYVIAERDEAREERDIAKLEFEEISYDLSDARNRIWQLENQIEGLNNFANERFDEIQKVRKERDEAREALREIAEASGFDNIGNWARNGGDHGPQPRKGNSDAN